jgi:hypothetical protein
MPRNKADPFVDTESEKYSVLKLIFHVIPELSSSDL